ncbi:protein of unknown function [Amycolatopsis marina]|uniref:DUF397 domain-containing protein n=1 Tax=Amycolatopsis marina TaxID=490629 RepID=A0A1I1B6Q2_9PSEU|nr:DUF397 domain-containing protein [Amycolatopsis marina]SFB45737.1 protein of unknown function [Amycolatopsis marina]
MSEQDLPGSAWRRSSYSDAQGNGNCVEVSCGAGAVTLRDSKDPGGGLLTVPAEAWRGLRAALRG